MSDTQIWVDADACPVPVKEILYRAAERAQVHVTLVANHAMRTPPSRYVRSMQVAGGFDVADAEIVRRVAADDLVVTQDIPLAAQVLDKGAQAVNPRGVPFTPDSIAQQLSMRNFMEELRGSGMEIGGPSAFSQSDRQAFAAALDRFLARPR